MGWNQKRILHRGIRPDGTEVLEVVCYNLRRRSVVEGRPRVISRAEFNRLKAAGLEIWEYQVEEEEQVG
ncbi:MAG: hypothetical protein ACOX8W_06590 [bacterium]|jgi:hypothetical protein